MLTIDNQNVLEPLRLTPKQQWVLGALKNIETEEYPLSRWYLGSLYTLHNDQNPDRIAQAAHSLRELLEKLPRVVEGSDVQGSPTDFRQKRRNIFNRILKDRENYVDGWENKMIDKHLDNTLKQVEKYLESNQQPTRREQMHMAVSAIDPMANQFHRQIRERKRDELYGLWRKLQGFAHHNSEQHNKSFKSCLETLENTVFDLLAPITAQDHKVIQTILGNVNRTKTDEEKMFSLIERSGANYVFFFKHATKTPDTVWLRLLKEKGYFADLPNAESIGDERGNFPFWWPIRYLARMAPKAPDDVIQTVLRLPKTDNPWVYNEILEMALRLPGSHSVKLEPKISEYVNLDCHFLACRFADLLAHWTAENQTAAALKLTKALVEFVPDPQDKAKRKRRGENPKDSAEIATVVTETQLDPSPRIDDLEYPMILSEGVRPLAQNEPLEVAHILINATAKMICLRTHQDDLNKDVDFSEYWCERLTESDGDYEDAEKSLVHTLTSACEQVHEKLPDSVSELDTTLRKQQAHLFNRLRHHLFALHPNKTTKPWIQELIRNYEGYNLREYDYEFQKMIQNACQYFGSSLLTEAERERIFDAICDGPSKADYRAWLVDFLGDEFTDEKFKARQRCFHRMQLRPFERLLFGKYASYFHDLEHEAESLISDECYGPSRIQTSLGANNHSPIAQEDLANFRDEELLDYMNHWHNEDPLYDGKRHMWVNIQGLSQAFETVFKESIIPNPDRLGVWMENVERIERPIFLEKMLAEMRARIEANNFDKLHDWLEFCHQVLIHTDCRTEDEKKRDEGSEDIPEWYGPRRAVGDLIGTFLDKSDNVPRSAYNQLTKLFELLCTQSDPCLFRNPNQFNPFTHSLNCVRSRALHDLVKFGLWLRCHGHQPELSGVARILEMRLDRNTHCPLTLPEYAILGVNIARIFSLNEEWLIKHKSDFFPQRRLSSWLTAFGTFVRYSDPFKRSFEIFRDDYDIALQCLNEFKNRDDYEDRFIDSLGEHLFIYYLWDKYPLRGNGSMLESYYHATEDNRDHWGNLFDYVGRTLEKSGEEMEESLKEKIYRFFDWRIEFREHKELQKITFWLKAEGLDAEWRLKSYSKILNFCRADKIEITIQVDALCKMLPNHLPIVVECFAELTKYIGERNIYIRTEKAKAIIQAGLASDDSTVCQNAEQAQENLLREGRFDLMELDDLQS